jgi:hypothetical protein
MTQKSFFKRLLRGMFYLLLFAGLIYTLLIVLIRPSNQRNWTIDQARTASVAFNADLVKIQNVRNSVYRSTSDFDVRWEQREYDLNQLDTVWFIVEPFADWRGPAHTFLSFGFSNGDYLAISVEIRKEQGESYSPLRGLFRQYELMYVMGDERDLIGLRANHRKDDVYLYKIRASKQKARELLVSMLQRSNQLATEPEFYNTLTNNCTSAIVDHVDLIAPERIPLSYKTLLPGYSDELAYDLELIETTATREEYRKVHHINQLAKEFADSEDFSAQIRTIVQ